MSKVFAGVFLALSVAIGASVAMMLDGCSASNRVESLCMGLGDLAPMIAGDGGASALTDGGVE